MVCQDKRLASVVLSSTRCSVWGEHPGLGAFCSSVPSYPRNVHSVRTVGIRRHAPASSLQYLFMDVLSMDCLVSYWRHHQWLVDPEVLHTSTVPAWVQWSYFDFGDMQYLWRLILQLLFFSVLGILCVSQVQKLIYLGYMSWNFQKPS